MREMVNFELGKEIKKDVLSPCHERGTSVVHIAVVRHMKLIPIWHRAECRAFVSVQRSYFTTQNFLPKFKFSVQSVS